MRALPVFMFCVATVAAAHLTYAQDTASEIEAVKRVAEAANAAVNAQKLDEMLAFYADDAKIDSKAAGRQVSKDQYREAMKNVLSSIAAP
jgi:ketosteroid isomerase-like protein